MASVDWIAVHRCGLCDLGFMCLVSLEAAVGGETDEAFGMGDPNYYSNWITTLLDPQAMEKASSQPISR